VLGLDVGIASCGWALIDLQDDDGDATPVGKIVRLGAWMFDAPETDKERTPTNQLRRTARAQRRVIRRRRQRMNAIRRLFVERQLLVSSGQNALKYPGLNPWQLRVEALDRLLQPEELAVALGHIAKHRGFKSNRKSDGANAADDSSKMLKAIEATREKSAAYRTIAEVLTNDPSFEGRYRNRSGDYSRSILRQDLEAETRAIFQAQRRMGNVSADQAFEQTFSNIAFFQRPLQDSETLLGPCPFATDQRRSSKRAPSFEMFRFLSRLINLRVSVGRKERPLTADELVAAIADFGKTAKITFKTLREAIALAPHERFVGISKEDEKRDVTSRVGESAFGTSKLRSILGTAGWSSMIKMPEKLDRIADIITFRDAPERIEAGLLELGLDDLIVKALMQAVHAGSFAKFTGTGHISATAARNIIPHLKQGLVYSDACERAGYQHSAGQKIDVADIGSPVARKALSEAIKQVKALIHEYGVPDAIHVELARDVGRSAEEREEIRSGIEKRNKEKDRLREQYVADIGQDPRTAEDLLRYELWKQQNCRCIYTDALIDPSHVAATSNLAQVDHILPWSRFGDDSFHNKVLVTTKANQEKKGRTPFEWFSDQQDDHAWDAFVARVEASKAFRGMKKRNLLLKNAEEVQDRFRARNLNDTRYTARALAALLVQKYPPEPGKRRVFARPGSITSKLRQAWGVQSLKKDGNGNRRSDDRHHALDALVCAATTEGALQRLTRAFQESERRGSGRELIEMPQPWKGFRDQAVAAFEEIFVARAERRRARGKAHDATIKQIVTDTNGTLIYERKSVDKLTLKDLDNIKDLERNAATAASLRDWINAGKPKDAMPRSPKGDIIRKVRLRNRAKDGLEIRGGIVDRGEMVRVDVFSRNNAKGVRQFFLVPVYPHQIAMDVKPPVKFVEPGKSEEQWQSVNDTFDFLFSVYPMSLIEIIKSDGEVLRGYFRGMDRSTGAVSLSLHQSKEALLRNIGARTLLQFNKLTADRLGIVSSIRGEVRTWRGAAST
jgi:CRISPR-associated endonuclease Csn1